MIINDIYLSNVKTFESLSESTLQLGFNGHVMKEFGVKSPWIQMGSAVLSMLSIFRSMAARYAFVQYNKDPGFSTSLAKSFAILFFPTVTIFLFQMISWTDEWVQSSLGIYQIMYFHPIMLVIYGKGIQLLLFKSSRLSSSSVAQSSLQSLHIEFFLSLTISVCGTIVSQTVSHVIPCNPLLPTNLIFSYSERGSRQFKGKF